MPGSSSRRQPGSKLPLSILQHHTSSEENWLQKALLCGIKADMKRLFCSLGLVFYVAQIVCGQILSWFTTLVNLSYSNRATPGWYCLPISVHQCWAQQLFSLDNTTPQLTVSKQQQLEDAPGKPFCSAICLRGRARFMQGFFTIKPTEGSQFI